MTENGKAGCGCLIFALIVVMVLVGVLMHPLTLRFLANQFCYGDKVFPSEALFVPRFSEDKDGELYTEALREYSAGNGKVIWVEEDTILGVSVGDLVRRMAQGRNVRENAVKTLTAMGEGSTKVEMIEEKFRKLRYRKVIILVPEYASRLFHLLYDSSHDEGRTLYLIKPVVVSYFKKDRWWKDAGSRSILLGEIYRMVSFYAQRLTSAQRDGAKKDQ
jgi:hypothetical protein